MHTTYLVSASIEFKHASLHLSLVIASISGDSKLPSLSEFHLTDDELILKGSNNSENQDSSDFRLKKVF